MSEEQKEGWGVLALAIVIVAIICAATVLIVKGEGEWVIWTGILFALLLF